jgi:hypothetical protein
VKPPLDNAPVNTLLDDLDSIAKLINFCESHRALAVLTDPTQQFNPFPRYASHIPLKKNALNTIIDLLEMLRRPQVTAELCGCHFPDFIDTFEEWKHVWLALMLDGPEKEDEYIRILCEQSVSRYCAYRVDEMAHHETGEEMVCSG